MHKRVMAVLERHEQEDRQAVSTMPWQDLVREDFCNAEQVIAQIQGYAEQAGLQPDTMLGMYHATQAAGMSTVPTLIRTEPAFLVHRHTSSFRAYYHSHDYYELVYVHQGRCVQHTQAGPLPVLLARGDACLLAPGAVHAMEPACTADVVLKIAIPVPLASRVRQSCTEACTALQNGLQDGGGMITLAVGTGRFAALLPALLEEHYFPTAYSEDAVCAMLGLLAAELARLAVRVPDKSPLLQEVAQRMYTEGFDTTLEQLAAGLGYSADHLGRRIRRESGESFTTLRGRLKLDEAARLLRNTDIPVDAVAAQLGYSSVSGFYKRFAAVYGITPAAYRRINAV